MTRNGLFIRIRRLAHSRKVKSQLRRLAKLSRTLAAEFVAFLRRHKAFTDTMAVGLLATLILRCIPIVGHPLAVLALAAAAAVGLARQLTQGMFVEPMPH